MTEPADIRSVLVSPTWDAARTMAEKEGASFIGDVVPGFGGVSDTGNGGAA